jgi:hypothetical protein
METMQVAEIAENKFHQAMSVQGSDLAFNLKQAMLIGIVAENGNVEVHAEIAGAEDIYDLLQSDTARLATKAFDYIAIATSGWAAPLPVDYDGDEELDAPSAHPERRRVRLFVIASRADTASVLRFQDDSEHPVLDAGQASGPLADAVRSLFEG